MADAGAALRPVLFWLHGGAFTTGTGAAATYDALRFAARHDVVVVTCNYRVGALGFLFLGGLQLNWVWSRRLPYTQFIYEIDPETGLLDLSNPIPTEATFDSFRSEFYIAFDW